MSKMATGKGNKYYVSVNFICNTDGSEKDEPSVEQLDEAFRAMLKESQKSQVSLEFEIYTAWMGQLDESTGDELMVTKVQTEEVCNECGSTNIGFPALVKNIDKERRE